MQILKNQILLMKNFIANTINHFKNGKAIKDIMPEKPWKWLKKIGVF